MTDWMRSRGRSKRKDELINVKLKIDPKDEPMPTQISGIYLMKLRSFANSSIVWRVLLTDRDLDLIVEAYEAKKPFTFREKKGEEFPQVEILKQ